MMMQKHYDKVLHLLKKIDAKIVFEQKPFSKIDIVPGYFEGLDDNNPFWVFEHWFMVFAEYMQSMKTDDMPKTNFGKSNKY